MWEMNHIMCRACGEFVQALPDDDELLVPRIDTCPDCGGTEFIDIHSGRTLQTDAATSSEK